MGGGAPRWDTLLRELAEKSFRANLDAPDGLAPRGRLLIVSLAPESDAIKWQGSPAACRRPSTARKLLEDRAFVVLENATSDWEFLRAMASAFNRVVLLLAMKNSWLAPEHAGGGGEFLKRVDALLARGVAPWRVTALFDSDRLVPDTSPKEKLVDDLAQRRVVALVLHKREIENYLPDDAIDDRRHHDRWVSLMALTRVQRDHFDMKKGFRENDGGDALIPSEQEELFKGTNAWHLKRLIGGFGGAIGERFATFRVTREAMTTVCETCPGEIERILDQIEEML